MNEESIIKKIAKHSIILFPFIFLFIVYNHPLQESMVCNDLGICSIEHNYGLNIKTKEQIIINSQSKLIYRKNRYINIPLAARHVYPRIHNGFRVWPMIEDNSKYFHKVFINSKYLEQDEINNYISEQKYLFEQYMGGVISEYKLYYDSHDANLFLYVFSFAILFWIYFQFYKKDFDEYVKLFYVLTAIYIFVMLQELFNEFQFL